MAGGVIIVSECRQNEEKGLGLAPRDTPRDPPKKNKKHSNPYTDNTDSCGFFFSLLSRYCIKICNQRIL